MFARTTARTAPRAARAARIPKTSQIRYQSSSSSSTSANVGSNSHFAAGLAGGAAAATLIYGAYYVSPSGKLIRSINKGSKEASKKYQEASQKLQSTTPDADQAINYIKEFCYSYVTWVPGGRQAVDAVFKDVDTLRQNHHDEVNQLVNDAYRQFQDLSKSSLSMETASKAFDILADLSKKFGNLAGDALTDILDNHPQIKQRFGGSIDQLKQMGEEYGPEAKRQVDQTWQQVKQIMGSGLTAANLDKARCLVEEKVEQVQKLGDEAWKKGMEQAKPYLDKNPKVKELIEKNEGALRRGNVTELFQQAKKAAESGNIGDLENHVDSAVEKSKSKGSQLSSGTGLEQYFNMIPNGSEILSRVSQLREVAEKHADEGEKLLRETMDELKQVLEKKSQKAKEIVDKEKKP
ncbi:hypothetical protein DL764_008813 [Monosporascus ibericus]|uniref:Uncharacterized protein n=1 Tax=Monosporascus ibericus TaxID=155417 RepID=A0A4Q4SZZ0_9PEZI|nr:hypothetical protein DL764_008813 [Monosporascus ibericus]